ncbi:hypothetical protein PV721_05005 [Streptomyces sp. MB09-01]|uniref:hypothetical protein n=1 Tax=Streptomyces sp. MB09-01 TaxID=3028666 RepID=UPI0029A141F8|nr:hypothetical protein [Streptomyces sp. MB09-01]MDX3533732.1 hypothetical protein [Streptomyces sp. MB09-01]
MRPLGQVLVTLWRSMQPRPYEHGDGVNPLTVKHLNRLSGLLFILSRLASADSHGGAGDLLREPRWGARRARRPEG